MTPPASHTKNNGYVKWPSFLTILTGALVAGIALNTFVWAQHGQTMDQFEKRMVEQFKNVEKRLDRIDNKLEKRNR